MKSEANVISEGDLRFYIAKDTTVLASTPLGNFKLFKIIFGKDGSIYVPFPYLETKRGLLSEVDPATEPDPRTLNLRRNGVLVEEDVKFAHHTTGIVHFSKTKNKKEDVLILPGRRSFPLHGEGGHVFEARFFWRDGLKEFDQEKDKDTFPLSITLPEHPTGLRVWALWRTKNWVLSRRDKPHTIVGPQHVGINRETGNPVPFAFLGRPDGYALQEHLLFLSFNIEPAPTGADVATMLFWGGHDSHDAGTPATTKMLAFMYPYDGAAP